MKHELTVIMPFSSAHFYAQTAWSDEKNRAEFGRCYTPYGHGHNYRAEVTFTAPTPIPPAEEETLKALVHGVTDRLDHRHLNFDLPAFRDAVPTTENIALWIAAELEAARPPHPIRRIRLYEMDDLFAEVEP